jgi:hypothetical protein
VRWLWCALKGSNIMNKILLNKNKNQQQNCTISVGEKYFVKRFLCVMDLLINMTEKQSPNSDQACYRSSSSPADRAYQQWFLGTTSSILNRFACFQYARKTKTRKWRHWAIRKRWHYIHYTLLKKAWKDTVH